MKNLAVKVTADIGGYTTNMELASRVARERMGQSSAAVDDFQKSVDRSADELGRAARSMGSNMQSANDAIMRSANSSSQAIAGIADTAKEVQFKSLGDKVSESLQSGIASAKTHWEEFSAWSEAKAKATGIAVGLVMAAVGLGAVYGVYRIVKAGTGFIAGLFSGDSYKSANIDALVAANKEIKEIQESLRLSAQDAGALQAALAGLGVPKADYVSVYQAAEKAIRGNTEELDRLGIKYKDAKGNLLPLEQVVRNASTELDTYTEGWDRNAAATAIGIGTVAQLKQVLSVSAEAIGEARERLNDYNLGIGPEAQAAVDRYQTAMRTFNQESKLTSEGFKRAIADQVMPLLTDLATFFKDGFPFAVNAFRYSMATVTSLFYGLKTVAYLVSESVIGSLSSIGSILGGVGDASARLLKGDFTGAKEALVKGWDDAKARLGLIGDNIVAQARHNAEAMRQAWGFDDRRDASGRTPARGKAFVPKPDVASAVAGQRDDVDKAIMEGALKAQEAIIAAEKAQLGARQQFLQGYYQQEYLTAGQYYGTKQELILDALKVELDAYDKEIAALEVYRETRRKDTASAEQEKGIQDANNRIAEVQAKKSAAIADANKAVTLSLIERSNIQRQFDLQSREWNRQETLNNDALQFGIDMMGKNTIEVAKATAARRIQLAVDEQIYQLRRKDPNADVSQALANAADQTARAQQLIQEQADKQRDGWFGAGEAIRKYGEAAADVGAQVEQALSNGFRGAEDAVVNFVKTGKLNFKSFADSVISDLIRMQFKAAVTTPLNAALNSAGGVGGFLKSLLGGGSSAAPEQLGFSPAQLASMPSYDVGTDYVPRDGPAYLHRGERVTPASENRGDGAGVTIVQHNDFSGVDPMSVARVEAKLEALRRSTYEQVRDSERRRVRS